MRMKIFELCTQADKGVVLRTGLDYFQTHFVGKPMSATWRSPRIEVSNRSKPVQDFVSWMLSAPVVSTRGKECLEALLDNAVEFLPLIEVKTVQLYAINVTNVVECLDIRHSDLLRDSTTGEIINVRRFHFDLERIPPHTTIFKVPEDTGYVFVFQAFIDAVVKYKLTGTLLQSPASNPFSGLFPNSPDILIPY